MSRRRAGFFRVIRYDKTLRGSRNALGYVAFRSEDVKGKEPCIFDERHDHADVDRFMRGLEQPVTRHPAAAKAYHCVFSLNRSDFDRAGMTDWRDEVREIMRTYELESGKKLEWIASYHDNEGHPHCHVIIRATYTNQSGQQKKLFLNRQEVQKVKEITSRVMEARLPTPERQPPQREYRMPNQMAWAVGSVLQWLEQRINEERRRRKREEEERYRRWLHEDHDRDDDRGR